MNWQGWQVWITSSVLLALWLIAGHYIRWPAFILRCKPISRIARYAYGLTGIILAYALLVSETTQDWQSVANVFTLSVIGGVVVALCYGYDYLMAQNDRERRRNRHDTDEWRTNDLKK